MRLFCDYHNFEIVYTLQIFFSGEKVMNFNCIGENKGLKRSEQMNYISDEEREKCRKVVDAYAELYEVEDIFVVDAEGYGFVKLLYYTEMNGFETMETYTDSKNLFDDLWSDWLDYQLYEIVSGTLLDGLNNDEILNNLPQIIQKEIRDKYVYFAKKAGILLK